MKHRGGHPQRNGSPGRVRHALAEAKQNPSVRHDTRNPAPRYRYLATSDEGDACHCCGRANLKRYVWLAELDEDGNAIDDGHPYGTTCAGHLLRGSCGKKPTVSQANDIIEYAKARSKAQFHDEFSKALEATARLRPPEPERGTNAKGTHVVRIGDVEETYAARFDPDVENSWRNWGHDKIYLARRRWHERRALEWMQERGQLTDLAPRSIGSRYNNPDDGDAWMDEYEAWERLRDAREIEFSAEVRAVFERDGYVAMPAWSDDSEWQVVLTKSARPGAAFQVTDFRNDEPLGHREFDTLGSAIGDLWYHAPPSRKRLPPVPNPKRARNLGRRVAAL